MQTNAKKITQYTDRELLDEYHKITAYLATVPGHSMDSEVRIAENRLESLIAEGLDRGLFRR